MSKKSSLNNFEIHPTSSHSTASSGTTHDEPIPLHTFSSHTNSEYSDFSNTVYEKDATPDPSEIVPRKERRGLLAQLCLIPERTNPYDHSPITKATILILVAFASIIAPMGGAIFLPAIDTVVAEFHSTKDVINISYGIYVFALAVFPLWWSSFSEQFGRRSIYLISFSGYACLLIGSACAKNISTLMICRFFAGGFAASVQAVGAGTISDIYVTAQRGRAIGYFYLGPLLGPLLGPIVGGLVNSRWGWRGTQWFLVIMAGGIVLAVILLLPETLLKRQFHETGNKSSAPQEDLNALDEKANKQVGLDVTQTQASAISRMSMLDNDIDNTDVADTFVPVYSALTHQDDEDDTKVSTTLKTDKERVQDLEAQLNCLPVISKTKTTASEKERRLINASAQIDFKSLSFKEKFFWLFFRPLKSFKFFQYPPVLLTISYGAFCFMTLYFMNVSLESLYSQAPYNFGSILVGLTYIPNSMGYFISSILTGRYSDKVIRREKTRLGYFNPESRFAEHYLVAMVVYPLSLVFFGWTAQYKLHWTIPLVANLFFGLSSIVVMSTSATYLVDALPGKGSSGVALNNFVRFSTAGLATFISEPMNRGLGYGWMYTLLAIIALLSSVCILSIMRWGSKWRGQADFEKLYR